MREHGDYVSNRSEQVILFSARGPWNDQTMRRGVVEMAKHIDQLPDGKPWGQISCLYAESLMPPSTYALFRKQTLIRKDMGLSAIAVVIKNSDVTLTIKAQLSDVYLDCNIKHCFCDSLEQAYDWLKDMKLPFNRNDAETFFHRNAF